MTGLFCSAPVNAVPMSRVDRPTEDVDLQDLRALSGVPRTLENI
jgi:hypothetical protein